MSDTECPCCNDAGLRIHDFDAAVFDLDGVVIQTARGLAASWKRLFDEYLIRRADETRAPFQPFDIDNDYRRCVDGKPRYDGTLTPIAARPDEAILSESTCSRATAPTFKAAPQPRGSISGPWRERSIWCSAHRPGSSCGTGSSLAHTLPAGRAARAAPQAPALWKLSAPACERRGNHRFDAVRLGRPRTRGGA